MENLISHSHVWQRILSKTLTPLSCGILVSWYLLFIPGAMYALKRKQKMGDLHFVIFLHKNTGLFWKRDKNYDSNESNNKNYSASPFSLSPVWRASPAVVSRSLCVATYFGTCHIHTFLFICLRWEAGLLWTWADICCQTSTVDHSGLPIVWHCSETDSARSEGGLCLPCYDGM